MICAFLLFIYAKKQKTPQIAFDNEDYFELLFILNAFIIFSDLSFCCMISVSFILILLFGYWEKSLMKKWKIAWKLLFLTTLFVHSAFFFFFFSALAFCYIISVSLFLCCRLATEKWSWKRGEKLCGSYYLELDSQFQTRLFLFLCSCFSLHYV